MKVKMLQALNAHFIGEIAKHKMNVEIFLAKPTGVGEHIDILETISAEMGKIAEYEDKLGVIVKHFQENHMGKL